MSGSSARSLLRATAKAGCSYTSAATNLNSTSLAGTTLRSFSTSSRGLAAAAKAPPKKATKQSSGFGHKKKEVKIRKGGEIAPVKFDHPSFSNPKGPTTLPELVDVDVTRAIRYKPVAFSLKKTSALNAFGVPITLGKDLKHLDQPFAVVRDVTLSSFEKMQTAAQRSSAQNRFVYTGPTGCGKSVALLQTVEYCAKQGWFVLYVPKAIDWVNSTTPYQYDARSQSFLQPALASTILKQISSFNSAILNDMTVPEDIVLDRGSVSSGSVLKALVDAGVNDAPSAPHALKALLEILAAQEDVPVLLAIDDFQALYSKSQYRDPEYKQIEAMHLSTPRLFLEYASGKSSFARGAVVGAISTTNTDFAVPIELKDALGLTPEGATSTWAPRNPEYSKYSEGLSAIPVPAQFNVHEAATLVEVWNQTASLHSDLNESVFLAKLAESGGNPREFLHRGYMSTLVAF